MLIAAPRKHHTAVDALAYRAWLREKSMGVQGNIVDRDVAEGHDDPNPVAPASVDSPQTTMAPPSASFTHIADLIMKGEQVPNVRDVPDTTLGGQESVPNATKRKKPWEN